MKIMGNPIDPKYQTPATVIISGTAGAGIGMAIGLAKGKDTPQKVIIASIGSSIGVISGLIVDQLIRASQRKTLGIVTNSTKPTIATQPLPIPQQVRDSRFTPPLDQSMPNQLETARVWAIGRWKDGNAKGRKYTSGLDLRIKSMSLSEIAKIGW
jgi:hypothetical protein